MPESTYNPTYKWYETDADLLTDNSVLESSGDKIGNQVFEGAFTYGRYGGCLTGTLKTTEDFTTFVRKGWWVLAYLNPNNDPVWVGRVFEISSTRSGGVVSLLGPIHYFNGFVRQVPHVDRIPLEVAIYDMAKEMKVVNAATSGLFVPANIYTGHFPGWDPQGQDVLTLSLSTRRQFQDEIASVAGAVDNLFYGFFPTSRKIWITQTMFDENSFGENPSATTLDFQIARGTPPRTRFFQEEVSATVIARKRDASQRFNRVVLVGESTDKIWVAQDATSLQTEPPRSVWARKAEIGNDGLGRRIADNLLQVGIRDSEYYEVDIHHNTASGEGANLVESGPVLPWSDRPVIKDRFNSKVRAEGIVRAATLTMGEFPSQRIQIGEGNLDIKKFFGLTSFNALPSQDSVGSPGVLPWEPETSHQGPTDISDPPVGIFVGPINQPFNNTTEALRHVIPAAVYKFRNLEIVGKEYRTTVAGVDYHWLITKVAGYQTVSRGTPYNWQLGYLDQLELRKMFRWADPLTIPFWRHADTQVWQGMASIYENKALVDFEDLLQQSSSFLWTNMRLDSETPNLDSLVAKLRHGQITSSRIGRLQRADPILTGGHTRQGYIVLDDPGNTDVGGDGWLPLEGKEVWYEDLHFVPYSLILHLGGTQRGTLSGADTNDDNPNWKYIMDTYGGDGNIYSVESTYLPYEVTISGTPSRADEDPYYPQVSLQSDESQASKKNIFYFTKDGAAAAESLGWFWHEFLAWTTDVTTMDLEDATPLDAHDMGTYGVFSDGRTAPDGTSYDVHIDVPLDMPRMLTLYDVHDHDVLKAYSGSKSLWYSGPDGHGDLLAQAEAFDNRANDDGITAAFVNPIFDNLKLVRKKITFSSINPAPPDIYKGDIKGVTYPPPFHLRSWKVRGFDDTHSSSYDAVNNQ